MFFAHVLNYFFLFVPGEIIRNFLLVPGEDRKSQEHFGRG